MIQDVHYTNDLSAVPVGTKIAALLVGYCASHGFWLEIMAPNNESLADPFIVAGNDLLEHAHQIAANINMHVRTLLDNDPHSLLAQLVKLKAEFAELQLRLQVTIQECEALRESSSRTIEEAREARSPFHNRAELIENSSKDTR
jgi:hypothetical protein